MKNVCSLFVAFLLAAVLLFHTRCSKKFDAPPPYEEPGVPVNTSIMQLKAKHTAGAFEQIKEDITISGIVIGDDKSGNLYKQIVIQDSTGGIVIRLDGSALYTSYPVGRRIFVKCRGLYISDYNRLVQLGGGVDKTDPAGPELAPIAVNLQEQYLVKGALNQAITPRVVTPAQLTSQMMDSLQSTLVQLEHMEFAAGDTAKTYADTSKAVSAVNYVIRNCDEGSITLRNSSYASFAGIPLPKGNGTVVGIFTVYGSTRQLNIRDTSDVHCNNARCSGSVESTVQHIADLRAMYKGSGIVLETHHTIKGIVVSDHSAGNIADNTIVLQEGNGLAGIRIHFATAVNFELGDSLEVDVNGLSLEEYEGTLELNNVPGGNAVKTGKGTIAPRVVTAAQLGDAAFFKQWESTVVSLQGVTASGGTGGTWQGTVTLTDGTGTANVFTSEQAVFAKTAYPAAIRSFTGILTTLNGQKMLTCRNAADIVTEETPPAAGNSIVLQTSPLVLHLDDIGNGLPPGIQVRTGATKNDAGKEAGFTGAKAAWTASAGGFKNFASGAEVTAGSDQATQDKATNRALGLKQVANTNASFPDGDPGAAFVLVLENTAGKYNLQLDFLLQSLDAGSGRTTSWTVDYATGEQPASFTPATATGTLSTGNSSFASNPIHVDFGNSLDNINSKVWIRIVTLSASSGSGSRPATAIDELRFEWKQ
jgi:hypothetical protein